MPFPPIDDTRTLHFEGQRRTYDFHVPGGFRQWFTMPVVLVLHGGGGDPAHAAYVSLMNDVADRHGFIVLYPAGTHPDGNTTRLFWQTGHRTKDPNWKSDDVGFIGTCIEDLGRRFWIDRNRVYATGISNGAQMCFRLATEIPIAAIGTVASHMAPNELPNRRGIPIIHFHGRQDRFAPIAGGGYNAPNSPFQPFALLPLDVVMDAWSEVNNCFSPTDEYTPPIRHQTFSHPVNPIEVYVLDDNGHTWPGGQSGPFEQNVLHVGPVSQAVKASELMWQFFKAKRFPFPVRRF